MKNIKRLSLPVVFAFCLACISGSTPIPPKSLEDLQNRMRNALSQETADQFLSLFYSDGMDDRVRKQLVTVIERHLGMQTRRISEEPPSDCSLCTYEFEGVTYSLPFEPDGWLRIDFEVDRESRPLETPVSASLSFLYVKIDGSYYLMSALPDREQSVDNAS